MWISLSGVREGARCGLKQPILAGSTNAALFREEAWLTAGLFEESPSESEIA
jgi:hypothetical protein